MNTMKNGLKLAVIAALALPMAAQAALQYTPPQAMVLTCNGSAPNVLNKTSALATFACANGQVPQAVGVTSGLGDLLGLASGASILAASEAVPQLALPSSAPASGGPASGNGSNSSNASGNGSNSGNGNGNGSNSGNGAGSGNGSNASGNGAGSGSSGPSNGSGSGGGGFLGHLLNSVGSVVQRIGHAVVTGGTVNIPLMGGASTPAQGTIAEGGSNNTGSLAGGTTGYSGLNHNAQANKPAAPVSVMTGAAPGTIEIHSQPRPFVLTGGPAAYRGLVRWISGYESMLGSGGGHLDTVVHPGTVTPERLADGPSSYFPYNRMTGTVDLYITESGHKYIAYPGNPVRFVSQRGTGQGYIQPSIWMAADNIAMQAANTYASGPQYYTSVPGNRNGPFWPSPFTIGSPGLDTASVCHGMRQITHVSLGAFCWSSRP